MYICISLFIFSYCIEWTYFWRKNGKYKKAAEIGEKAIFDQKTKGKDVSYKIYYLVACNYALARKAEKAIEFLKKSLDLCLESKQEFLKHIRSDPDLQDFIRQPEFQKLLQDH